MAKLTKRKTLTLIALITWALSIGLAFLPLYRVNVYNAAGSTILESRYGTIFEAMWCVNDPKNVARVIVYCIDMALLLIALVLYIRSIAQPVNSLLDKEDKYFVFGTFCFVAGWALKGMGDFGFGYTIMVFFSLFFALVGILYVVIHHKKVVDY